MFSELTIFPVVSIALVLVDFFFFFYVLVQAFWTPPLPSPHPFLATLTCLLFLFSSDPSSLGELGLLTFLRALQQTLVLWLLKSFLLLPLQQGLLSLRSCCRCISCDWPLQVCILIGCSLWLQSVSLFQRELYHR